MGRKKKEELETLSRVMVRTEDDDGDGAEQSLLLRKELANLENLELRNAQLKLQIRKDTLDLDVKADKLTYIGTALSSFNAALVHIAESIASIPETVERRSFERECPIIKEQRVLMDEVVREIQIALSEITVTLSSSQEQDEQERASHQGASSPARTKNVRATKTSKTTAKAPKKKK